jgi:hypothetical protein
MIENYYALHLAIIKNISVNQALGLMGIRGANKRSNIGKSKRKYEKKENIYEYIDDPVKLIELKKAYTYKEIAKMYNTYPNKVFDNIKHFKQITTIQS